MFGFEGSINEKIELPFGGQLVRGCLCHRHALAAQVRVVLVSRGSETETLMQATPGFVAVGGDATTALYERVGKREL